jgi:hypothetical protein
MILYVKNPPKGGDAAPLSECFLCHGLFTAPDGVFFHIRRQRDMALACGSGSGSGSGSGNSGNSVNSGSGNSGSGSGKSERFASMCRAFLVRYGPLLHRFR